MKKISVYSDGGCRMENNTKGNTVKPTDKSGYAFRIESDGVIFQDGKGMYGKTNNQMELTGYTAALEWLIKNDYTDASITSYLDSQYVLKGIQEWMSNWKKNGWKNSKKQPVANKDEWVKLDSLLVQFPSISYEWVKGHADTEGNNAVDRLLNEKMDGL